jgi:hypothetical protein
MQDTTDEGCVMVHAQLVGSVDRQTAYAILSTEKDEVLFCH